jgi:hypothetical protein
MRDPWYTICGTPYNERAPFKTYFVVFVVAAVSLLSVYRHIFDVTPWLDRLPKQSNTTTVIQQDTPTM